MYICVVYSMHSLIISYDKIYWYTWNEHISFVHIGFDNTILFQLHFNHFRRGSRLSQYLYAILGTHTHTLYHTHLFGGRVFFRVSMRIKYTDRRKIQNARRGKSKSAYVWRRDRLNSNCLCWMEFRKKTAMFGWYACVTLSGKYTVGTSTSH